MIKAATTRRHAKLRRSTGTGLATACSIRLSRPL
jgi:hypothetical protein